MFTGEELAVIGASIHSQRYPLPESVFNRSRDYMVVPASGYQK
jgi:hypothetical protein